MSTHDPGPATYGHPLAYVRAQRGWSAAGLLEAISASAGSEDPGRPVRADRNKVHRWEARGVVPAPSSQRALARLLGVPSRRLSSHPWPHWLPAYHGVSRIDGWWPGCALRAIADAVDGDPADRRGYLPLTGAPLRRLAASWLDQPSATPIAVVRGSLRVAEPAAARIEQQAAGLRRLDERLAAAALAGAALAGAALAGAVAAQLRLVCELLTGGSYSAGAARRLYLAAADLGCLGGWLASGHGRHFAAQLYFRAALHAAHRAGEPILGGYVLACLGYQAVGLGHRSDASHLAAAALEVARRSAAARAAGLLAGHARLITLAAAGPGPAERNAAGRGAAGWSAAGRGAAGRSAAGRGAAGRGAAGRGAAVPAPAEPGGPSVPALADGEPAWAWWFTAPPLAAFTASYYRLRTGDPDTAERGAGDRAATLVRRHRMGLDRSHQGDGSAGRRFGPLHALAEQLAAAGGAAPDAASVRAAVQALLSGAA